MFINDSTGKVLLINLNFKKGIIFSGILFMGILFMLSPFFYFTDITVTGNLQISEKEILNRAGLDQYVNFFLFNPHTVRRNIMKNHYIDQIDFNRTLPGTLEITVTERFLSGYIEYLGGMFLYMDENGRVLEVRSYMKKKLPIITGLYFSRVHLGQPLEVDNPLAFSTAATYAQLLNRHGLIDIISQVDVSDPTNTRVRLYNIEVYLGDTRNANEKIMTLREIVNEWPVLRYARGFLDLRELSSEYVFRNLT